jgi:hypothetical protein
MSAHPDTPHSSYCGFRGIHYLQTNSPDGLLGSPSSFIYVLSQTEKHTHTLHIFTVYTLTHTHISSHSRTHSAHLLSVTWSLPRLNRVLPGGRCEEGPTGGPSLLHLQSSAPSCSKVVEPLGGQCCCGSRPGDPGRLAYFLLPQSISEDGTRCIAPGVI